MLTSTEAVNSLFQAINNVRESIGEEWLNATFPALVAGWRPVEYLYQPDKVLLARLEDYRKWCLDYTGENVGQLMEEIALLAFRCLKGFDSVKSYQSYAAQLDLVVTGSSLDWRTLMQHLHLDWSRRAIVVEAKNLEEKVDDKQFTRLCAILEGVFSETAFLGIFFSRYGATGFPEPARRDGRMRVLRDAQATQIIFHARTNKFVVVFDHEDILQLDQPGALPKLLASKIQSIEEWTGLHESNSPSDVYTIDLPAHLKKYME